MRAAAPAATPPGHPVAAGRTVLVANPAAAGVDGAMVATIVDRLAGSATGASPEVVWTSCPGDAQRVAAGLSHDVATVVAVGGDGTAREVAAGLWARAVRPPGRHREARPALVVVPAGSGNSTARNLWGDREWPSVLDDVVDPARHRVRHIDLLHLVEWDVVAVLGASSGFLAQVLIDARGVSGLTGRDRYYAAAAGVLAAMPDHPTRVTLDGRVVRDGGASLVAVGGGRFRANAFQFLPEALLDDGLLDVCIIDAIGGAALDEVAAGVPTGDHAGHAAVGLHRGRSVTIERTDGHDLVAEFDGEVHAAPGARLTVEVLPGALTVLAPRVAPAG